MAKTILLVIRDEQIIKGLKVLLESEGYLVRTAKNGREAVKSFEGAFPDLVLLEVTLPPELSYEEARLLKQVAPRTPVILMTEVPLSEPDRALGFQVGVDGFIPKPQAFPELLSYLEEKLRTGETAEEETALPSQSSSVSIFLATCPECRAKFKAKEGRAPEKAFRLECPSCQYIFLASPAQLEAVEPSHPMAPFQQPSGAKVLVVEDTDLFRNYVVDILRGAGYQVVTAINGSEALGLLPQERPDLVLTDLLLPGLHGFDLCKEIKARFGIPVIMMTGVYKSLQYQLEGRWRYGADEFLVKPFSPEEILGKVKGVLAKRRGEG
ncbi:MAG: response regulator [candidate division NC10 bacterium]|nr:response regulator [candidate division NC10 bacterium]